MLSGIWEGIEGSTTALGSSIGHNQYTMSCTAHLDTHPVASALLNPPPTSLAKPRLGHVVIRAVAFRRFFPRRFNQTYSNVVNNCQCYLTVPMPTPWLQCLRGSLQSRWHAGRGIFSSFWYSALDAFNCRDSPNLASVSTDNHSGTDTTYRNPSLPSLPSYPSMRYPISRSSDL